ncbi:type II secretion system protein [Helicobacter aurati]|uniref:Type II secretion system protein n=1 Tax=Helicobacter aurati TaxID=137778 RepID=A0A3D8J5D2_9HELI|nr:type II secretion system protein [Helicobacter aurati]RDU72702.1 type II secretion system protein [Helicobacter aurati]
MTRDNEHPKTTSTFSIIEVLFVIFIVGLISIPLLKTLQSLQAQNHRIQAFLVKKSSLFETQLFINKHINLAKIDSIVVTNNTLKYEAFNNLFIPTQSAHFMDISLQTIPQTLQLTNGNLYFNNALLLKDVQTFIVNIQQNQTAKNESILYYKLCLKKANECIEESLFLDNIEIPYQ